MTGLIQVFTSIFSVSLDKMGVTDIGLKSLSNRGLLFLAIGVTTATRQLDGTVPVDSERLTM